MNKKDVRIAEPLALNSMVKHDYINSVSVASNASKHLFGNRHTIESIADNTGLNCGSPKIIVYDNCPNNQDIANLNLSRSKITGLISCLQRIVTTGTLSMSSMMRHTSIKMAAL